MGPTGPSENKNLKTLSYIIDKTTFDSMAVRIEIQSLLLNVYFEKT